MLYSTYSVGINDRQGPQALKYSFERHHTLNKSPFEYLQVLNHVYLYIDMNCK